MKKLHNIKAGALMRKSTWRKKSFWAELEDGERPQKQEKKFQRLCKLSKQDGFAEKESLKVKDPFRHLHI